MGTHAAGTGADFARSRAQLIAENALLRQQLLVLRRCVARPTVTKADRALLVLLASRVRAWRQALLLVQPETLLHWHRVGFRALWRRKSRPGPGRLPLAAETIALIRQMAAENPLWGAERIRGELLKLDIRVAKRTIQTYLRGTRPPRSRGQTWATFLRAHGTEIWACDFLPVTDLLFRPLFAFFVVELATRRVVHVGATRHPTDAWVAQQLREATPFGQQPRYLIRDNDGKYGAALARVAATSGITLLRTPLRAPRANATRERFLGSVRRECLDHLLVSCLPAVMTSLQHHRPGSRELSGQGRPRVSGTPRDASRRVASIQRERCPGKPGRARPRRWPGPYGYADAVTYCRPARASAARALAAMRAPAAGASRDRGEGTPSTPPKAADGRSARRSVTGVAGPPGSVRPWRPVPALPLASPPCPAFAFRPPAPGSRFLIIRIGRDRQGAGTGDRTAVDSEG